MEQLTLADIDKFITKMKKQGADISKCPIYLGDDDELNGIHCGWYIENLEKGNLDDDFVIAMINERHGNNKFNGMGILIS